MSDSDPAAFLKKLKDYPKRESRQSWSSYYQRMRSAQSELLDDPEIISEADFQNEVDPSKKVYLYRYHDGEIKLRADSRIAVYEYRDGTYEGAKAIRGVKLKFIDPSRKLIFLTIPTKPIPQKVCVMPASPLNTRSISDSIARYAAAPSKYPAVNSILQRQPSLFKEDKKVILRHKDELINNIIRKAVNLDNSHFTVQGPPGTGKTYVGARIILELILQGRRVGVMALSHKAINNLLLALDELLDLYNVRGTEMLKTRSSDNPKNGFHNINIGDVVGSIQKLHLAAGTVYTLSRLPGHVIDTLVIDEASQIPLAWIMAAGRTANNIVMMGDHKQLPQVSQSPHPEGSGESVLEFLMQDNSIIPAKFGDFLSLTRRMNPTITKFVSDLMYEGKLLAHEMTHNYILELIKPRHPALDKKGISWVEMHHSHCSQESKEEAEEVVAIVDELQDHNFPLSEILIIAPYRAQEALLRSVLPKAMEEQIGTVDRFQGREADIVIFSMTSSDGHHLPRDIEFLFSVNRLNVAISRARKKAIVIANQRLLTIPAENLEQLKLINSLCHLKHSCTDG